MSFQLLTRNILILFVLSLMAACGGYHDQHQKDYRLFFNVEDDDLRREAGRLVDEFNRRTGAVVLKLAPVPEEANSTVELLAGLRDAEGKLGFGQWETATVQEPSIRHLEGRALKRRIDYTMHLEFDLEYFTARVGLPDDHPERQELSLLFFHEVGHGLQMDHDDDPHSVMYPVIHGVDGINYDRFFERVAAFFGL